ncbi:MAG: hypothetical protein KIT83_05450 [Bryobacterales bacterium]|nr:hypothetical protein [Bryobacterales bacterium]
MSCFINATNERLYGATEQQYGQARALSGSDRLSFRQLKVSERSRHAERRDKTGSRTRFAPHPEVRTDNRFELDCYFATRDPQTPTDGVANLVEAALGGERLTGNGLTVSEVSVNGQTVAFNAAHGLKAGQAVRFQGQLRFVKSVVNTTTITLSAPLGAGVQAGSVTGKTVSMWPGDKPKPLTMGNYWTPAGTLDRVLAGCVVNEMVVVLNSDFHGASFRGTVREVASVTGFAPGSTGLTSFPAEPPNPTQAFQLVPGHVGRLFIGDVEYYLLDLSLRFLNNADTTNREFGMALAPCYSADLRELSLQFQLYAAQDDAVNQLHMLSRSRVETDLTIQLGNQAGQLVGIHVPRFVPEIPELKDAETRVVMSYPKSLAYGVSNDEISVAFA